MKKLTLLMALGIPLYASTVRADFLVSSAGTSQVLRYDNNDAYVGVFYNTGGNNGKLSPCGAAWPTRLCRLGAANGARRAW
jgi:hypothetical protein